MCVIMAIKAPEPIKAVDFIQSRIPQIQKDLDSKGGDGISITMVVGKREFVTKSMSSNFKQVWFDFIEDWFAEIERYTDKLEDKRCFLVLFSRQKPELEKETDLRTLPPFRLKKLTGLVWVHGTISNEDELKRKLGLPGNWNGVDSELLSYLRPHEFLSREIVKGWVSVFNILYGNDINRIHVNVRADLGMYVYHLPEFNINIISTLPTLETVNRLIGTPVEEFLYGGERLTELDIVGIESLYVAYSGGMDCTFSTYHVIAQNLELYEKNLINRPIKRVILTYFDYGQLAKEQEIKALKRFKEFLETEFPHLKVEPRIIDVTDIINGFVRLSNIGELRLRKGVESKEDKQKEAESNLSYVPFRNTIFAMVLKQLAENENDDNAYILFGLNLTEGMTFGDNSESWAGFISMGLRYAGKYYQHVKILAPFSTMTKTKYLKYCLEKYGTQVVKKLLDISFSCYYPKKDGSSCGECGSCILRQKALEMVNNYFNIVPLE